MSSLSDIHHRMRSEWSALEHQWQSTRSQWNDVIADHFERVYWRQLEEGVPDFLRKLELVEQTLDQALRSLNDR